MSTLQEDFVALLLADTGVAAQVGARIHWGISPQGEQKPSAVMNVISDSDDYTNTGVVDLSETRIQIDCYALDYLSAWRIARAVSSKLGGLKNVTQGNTLFQGIFQIDKQDGFNFDATTDKEFRVRMDFMVWHV